MENEKQQDHSKSPASIGALTFAAVSFVMAFALFSKAFPSSLIPASLLGVSVTAAASYGRWWLRKNYLSIRHGHRLMMGYFFLVGGPVGAVLGSILGAAASLSVLPFAIGGFVLVGGWWVYAHKYFFPWGQNGGLQLPEGQTSHGSAVWGRKAYIEQQGLFQGRGIIIGGYGKKLIHWDKPGHLITIAPTRTGKGIGAVIPNLLTWPGSVLVTDPKGENFAVTQRIRRTMGQRVFALDPFEVAGPSARLNPLDCIDSQHVDVADDAMVLADALLIQSGDSRASFWEDNARTLLQSLILFTLCEAPPENRNLPYVRRLLMSGPDEWEQVLGRMRESTAAHGLLSRLGGSIASMSSRTLQDVLATAKASTGFLDSPRLEYVLSGSDFDLADLKAGDLSVYLILPADKLGAYRRFLRLAIGAALQACTRAKKLSPFDALFLLDEFAQLGHMEKVKEAYTLLGGFGVRIWTFLQDLSQLEQIYKEGSQTFLANAAVKQFFGVADIKTAEMVSKTMGDSTITTYSSGNSESTGGTHSAGTHLNVSYMGRNLMKPDEIMRLPEDLMILSVQAKLPILGRKLNYLNDKSGAFVGRFDRNPMHQDQPTGTGEFHTEEVACPYCKRLNFVGRPSCEGCGGPLPVPAHEEPTSHPAPSE